MNFAQSKLFVTMCSKGQLEKAQEYYQGNTGIIRNNDIEQAFLDACDNNHLSVAQWLYSIHPDLDIHMRSYHVFYTACESKNMRIAIWLISLKEAHTNSTYYQYCSIAFANGEIELMRDIASRVPDFDVSYDNHHLYNSAMNIRRANIVWSIKSAQVIEWLQEMKPWVYKFTVNPNIDFTFDYNTFEHWNATYYPEKDTIEERNWQRRKYSVWLASNSCTNQKSILYKLPTDLSRIVISYV
jgi:hypothetical protein